MIVLFNQNGWEALQLKFKYKESADEDHVVRMEAPKWTLTAAVLKVKNTVWSSTFSLQNQSAGGRCVYEVGTNVSANVYCHYNNVWEMTLIFELKSLMLHHSNVHVDHCRKLHCVACVIVYLSEQCHLPLSLTSHCFTYKHIDIHCANE